MTLEVAFLCENAMVIQMCKAALQNRMALDALTATQGRSCAITKTKYYDYVPDDHKTFLGF